MLMDTKVDVKVKLAGLWTSIMFLYVYADYFELYEPGKLQHMLAGQMPPLGVVSQSVLLGTGIVLAIPSVMIALSLLLPAAINRWTSILVGVLYVAIDVLTMPGSWDYYLLYNAIEIVLTLLVVWSAWRWPVISER